MERTKIVLVLVAVILCQSLFAGSSGTTAVNYLKIGVGARAVGMGEAQVALADNVDSPYWNPAGLAEIKRDEIGLMHLIYWEGISYDYLAYATPIKDIGVFAVSGTLLNSGAIEKTIENLTGTDYTIDGTFNYLAFSGVISYATKFKVEDIPLSVGVNVKLIGDKIDTDSVMGVGLDIGAMSEVDKDLSVGLTASNFGLLFGKSVALPLTFKVGIAYRMELMEKVHVLTLAADGVLPMDSKIRANMGMEYSLNNTVYVRGGYKLNYDLESLTMGAGCRLNIGREQYELNYAFAPAKEDMGTTHRISFIVRFGLPVGEVFEQQQ